MVFNHQEYLEIIVPLLTKHVQLTHEQHAILYKELWGKDTEVAQQHRTFQKIRQILEKESIKFEFYNILHAENESRGPVGKEDHKQLMEPDLPEINECSLGPSQRSPVPSHSDYKNPLTGQWLDEKYSDRSRQYWSDVRNLQHKSFHWSICYDDGCETHLSGKEYLPRQPKQLDCGKSTWIICTNDLCPNHLIDKRKEEFFPGHTEEWNKKFNNTLQNDIF